MDKISIIVPFHNNEEYLDECIKSLINQTYSNLEIILVNDGSDDGSLKLPLNTLKRIHELRLLISKRWALVPLVIVGLGMPAVITSALLMAMILSMRIIAST